MRLERFYENTEILHVNTEPDRCYYLPCDAAGNSEQILLNGVWSFQYFPSVAEAEDFLRLEFDPEKMDEIPVPSCWQFHGYDHHQYVNLFYPIPYDPPYVPFDNPCGLYRRTFAVADLKKDKRVYLDFEGVDSCFYVWINKAFVGYSQVSHATSEFDVTKYLTEGENEIYVLVLKWCDGTYCEDQDKLRMSGIFRDVYLLCRPKDHIRDFTIRTSYEKSVGEICIDLEKSGSCSVKATLKDKDKVIGKQTGEVFCFTVEQPVLWNAEQPYLYTLELETEQEKIVQKIGIRTVEIVDRKLLVNGTPVKLKGVNRHDSNPYHGSAVTKEDAMTDLRLMKEHNVNAIRTSHYPNAPWFSEACDEYGFYLISESDMESHGCGEVYSEEDRDWVSQIAKSPDFSKAILDRVQKNVIRDKNRTCILFWSLGNESGYGPNMIEAAKWVKAYDPTRLVHYEGCTWQAWQKQDLSVLDVTSRMYAPLDWIRNYCENEENKKPFLHCECCHAMGNGPGDLEENFAQLYRYDNYCGAFIWEWCDHAVYAGTTPDGKEKFLYGGDFEDYPNDKNFCMDGLVYPNRKPHTGLLELKNVLRPVRVTGYDRQTGVLELRNMLDFADAEDVMELHYIWKQEEKVLAEERISEFHLPPHGTLRVTIPAPTSAAETVLTVELIQKKDAPLTKAGHLLGFDQIIFAANADAVAQELSPAACIDAAVPSPISCTETETEYCFAAEHFSCRVSKRTGTVVSFIKDGTEYLKQPMAFDIYRAPTDNDGNISEKWKEAQLHHAMVRVYESSAWQRQDGWSVRMHFSMAGVSRQKFFEGNAEWKIGNGGSIGWYVEGGIDQTFPFLPRFGLRFGVDRSWNQVFYYGYGPQESYCDKHRGSRLDVFTQTVEEMHEDYLKPQENGNHFGTRWVRLEQTPDVGFTARGAQPFEFGISEYTREELERKKHAFELEKSDFLTVYFNEMVSGVGSASCGPELAEKYQMKKAHFTWQMELCWT